ncbi:MAG: formate/nitrite transporter family protein [Oscillatoriaceae cyanobacterium Prado104]|jgi:formate/nitrite transporter FocA (FNT family)|nr:formate/nitrite transporter family protein [Oscillatoriaceae cyanobacterium Prado104]
MTQNCDRASEAIELLGQEKLELSDRDRQEIIDRIRPTALIIHETIRIEGENQLCRPVSALAWSGLAAGLSMGFSLVAQGLLKANLPQQSWSSIIVSLGYSIGFVIVVMGRQQLFTENTLTVILPLLSDRRRKVLLRVLRLWGIVLATNLLGAFIFASIAARVEVFPPKLQTAFGEIGLSALDGGFWTTLLRAIFAGWLIALMVWLLPAAESSQLWVITIITSLVGLGEFPHIIAGSVEVFYAVAIGDVSWSEYFGKFMIPTLIGNILGGVTLVAALNHAQVARDDI